ncbi:MAG: toll/interleukin-1 receptor domain-containing protein [Arcicella sp.]|jgi:TPR repeat protein|nr:toll/interleukin-1 receptor domain-containing protein [Arcicella sp.]
MVIDDNLKYDLYLSYSGEDFDLIDSFKVFFEAIGVRTFLAPKNMPTGEDWEESNRLIIQNSKVFLLILTKSSDSSDEVFKETITARNAVKEQLYQLDKLMTFMIDVKINDSKIYSKVVSNTHIINATEKQVGGVKEAFKKLINDVMISIDMESKDQIFEIPLFNKVIEEIETITNIEDKFEEAKKMFYYAHFETALTKFQAIEKRNINTLSYLGFLYYFPICSIEKDKREAQKYFNKAIENNDYLGYFGLGLMDLKIGNSNAFLSFGKCYEQIKFSDQGFEQFLVGYIHYFGGTTSREPNYRKAVEAWCKSSESGFLWANYDLAMLYQKGARGVAKDKQKEEFYLSKTRK